MPDNAPNQLIATGSLKIVPDTEDFDRFKVGVEEWLSGIERRVQTLFAQAQAATAGRPATVPDQDNKPVPATPDKLRDEPPPPPARIPEAFPDRPPVTDAPPTPSAPAEPPSGQDQVVEQLVALNSKLDLLGGEVVSIRTAMQERE